MKATYWAGLSGLVLAGVIAACAPQAVARDGAEDYAAYCAACHGPGGRGDGPAAEGLPSSPTDLTRIAARHDGLFPETQVMGHIAGYTMGRSTSPMPEFAELLEGPTVSYDDGSGEAVPTPARLVALMEYVQSIQR